MADGIHVGTNFAIISTGPDARNTVNVELPRYREPGEVGCPPGLLRLPSRTAPSGRRSRKRVDGLVGRAAELSALSRRAHVQIITGLGGVGKSALAEAHASALRTSYNPVWWIDCDDDQQIEHGLAALAHRLEPALVPHGDSVAAQWARTWLGGRSGWLLVLDNVARPRDVAEILSSYPDGRFLLTTRQVVGWEEVGATLRLPPLKAGDALDLLRRTVADPALLDGAEELCTALDGLPLAIEIASAFLTQNNVTASAYLERLDRPSEGRWAWSLSADEPRAMRRIWTATLDRLTPSESALLEVLSWYGPEQIPRELVDFWKPDPVADDTLVLVGSLASYALVNVSPWGDLSLHRLVQSAMRSAPPERTGTSAPRRAFGALHRMWMADVVDAERWQEHAVPHLVTLAAHTLGTSDAELQSVHAQTADLLTVTSGSHRDPAFWEKAAEQRRDQLGPEHPDTLTARNALARTYASGGNKVAAARLFATVIEQRERVLGPSSAEALMSRLRLADLLDDLGDRGKSIERLKRLADDCRRHLGPDHDLTIGTQYTLVRKCLKPYRSWRGLRPGGAGEYGRAYTAVRNARQILRHSVRTDGADSANAEEAADLLAAAYEALGLRGSAAKVVETHLAEYGKRDVALMYASALLRTRAVTLARSELERLSGGFPTDDFYLSDEIDDLAHIFETAGGHTDAVKLLTAAVDARERLLGPDNPSTLDAKLTLARALVQIRRRRDAIMLREQVLPVYERLHAPLSDEILTTRGALISAYHAVGDHSKAIALRQRTYDEAFTHLGPTHPTTLASHHFLALALAERGNDMPKARVMLTQVLHEFSAAYGPTDPRTLKVARHTQWSTSERLFRLRFTLEKNKETFTEAFTDSL
ncbi:tetratricopeptide repeat protein [Streptomyces sp. NPDC058964]|uniref:tetratricopeptide repeat protein n=1 Tax=Streptomyces sp. NPDC058964 TaxID=3346681 RepID=UPI0036A6D862